MAPAGTGDYLRRTPIVGWKMPSRRVTGWAVWMEEGEGGTISRDPTVTCSPKTDPGVMRVNRPEKAKETLNEKEASQSRADHPQAA